MGIAVCGDPTRRALYKARAHGVSPRARSGDDSGRRHLPGRRRGDDGRLLLKACHRKDNRDVVPYDPWLRQRSHVNMQLTAGIRAVKHYRGHDRDCLVASAAADDEAHESAGVDEVRSCIDARYVGPVASAWRISAFPLSALRCRTAWGASR